MSICTLQQNCLVFSFLLKAFLSVTFVDFCLCLQNQDLSAFTLHLTLSFKSIFIIIVLLHKLLIFELFPTQTSNLNPKVLNILYSCVFFGLLRTRSLLTTKTKNYSFLLIFVLFFFFQPLKFFMLTLGNKKKQFRDI